MAKTISQQVLDDFMATLATNPNADRKQLMQVFPEFGNDEKLLDAAYDYRETRLQNPMADMQTINSKFPEFFAPEPPVQEPMQQTNPSVAANPAPTTEEEYQANLQRQWEGEPQYTVPNNQQTTPSNFRTVDTSQPVLDPNAGQREVFMMGEPDEQRRKQLEAYERKRAANMPQMKQMWANDEKRFDEILAEAETQGAQAAGQVASEYGNAYQYAGMPGGTRLAMRGEMQAAANRETDPDKIAGQMMDEILARYEKQQEIETKRLIREGLSAKEENANLSEDEMNQLVNQTYDNIKSQPIEQLQQQAGVDDSDMAIYAEYVQEQMRNRFMDKYTPKDNWEYFARKVAEGNLLGQAVGAMIETPAQRAYKMQGTQRYANGHNTTWLDLGAEATNIVTDPTMYFFPAAGHAAANFGVRKLATSALTRKGIPYAAQVAERQLLQRGSWNAASRLLGGSLGFMGIDVAHDIANQMYMPVYNEKTGKYEEGAYDAMQTVGAAGKGAAMGAAFGLGGLMGDAVQRSVGQAYGKTIGAVAGKGTHYAMGTNLMFGSDVMSQIAQGTPVEDIDFGEAYRHAAMTQLFFDLWGGAKQFSANRNIRQKDGSVQHLSFRDAVRLGWNQTKDPYSERFTFTNEELEQLNKYINGGNNQEILLNLNSTGDKSGQGWEYRFYKQLDKIFTDPDVDTQTKYKLAYLLSGGDIRGNVRPIHVGGVEDVGGGKYQVRTYDNSAQTYSTRRFNSLADARRYEAEQQDITKTNKMYWLEGIAATYGFAKAFDGLTNETIEKTMQNYPQLTEADARRILTTAKEELSPVERAIKGRMESYLSKEVKGQEFVKFLRQELATKNGISEQEVNNILSKEYSELNRVEKAIFDDYLDRLTQEMPLEKEVREQKRAIEAGGGIPAEPVEPTQPTREDVIRQEVTDEVALQTHKNGYVYPVKQAGESGKTGFVVGGEVVVDTTDPSKPRISNDDIVTVKYEDGTIEQVSARMLDLVSTPEPADNVIAGMVEQRLAAEAQQAAAEQAAQNLPEGVVEFTNGNETFAVRDNGDGTYQYLKEDGTPNEYFITADQLAQNGYAMIPREQASQAPVQQVQEQPIIQEPQQSVAPAQPAEPQEPDFNALSAGDYAAAAVEYMGSRDRVAKFLDMEIKNAENQLKAAEKKTVTRYNGMADFNRQQDLIDQEIQALQQRVAKLKDAKDKAASYLTVAEREQMAKAEAERQAAAEAARIAREQAAAEAAAKAEQERIDRELKKGVPDFVEDNDRDARARGFHVQNGVVIRRQEPLQPLATGKATTVQFAKGDNGAAEAHHVLIPVSQAQPSHINGQRNPAFFISEAQPKDRRDQVSKVTSDMMAQNIHPDEIVEGATAYVGAPVLNNRGEAVQGNNRLDALIKMYQSHPESVAKYKQYLIDNAAALGYTEADIETIKNNDVIDVRMLDSVTDEQAIQLGQKKATDLETGGVQLIDPQVTASQLGDKIQRFSEVLLKSEDDEATLADLVLRNGKPALEYLQRLGIINDAQMQSAFDSRGNITAEAKAALQGVLKQVLFQNVKNDNLPILFDAIPLTAQKAILQTIVRDLQTKQESRLAPHIQEAIEALYDALQDNMVKEAKTEADVRRAMQSWASQIKISADSDAENLPGSEKFSNFARELATLFKYGRQKEIANKLDEYYNAVQGTKDMFGETPAISFDDAVKQVFGIEYNPIAPRASVSLADIEARLAQQRAEHRQELDEYLSTIADSNHPFVLFGNDNFIELLTKLGASQGKIDYVKRQLALGKTFEGFKIGNRLYLNADGLPTTDKARSKYVHERQHLLTTPEQIERVMRAASRDDLDVLVERLSESDGAYSNEEHDVLSEEFISFAMEVAYDVDTDAELEAALKAVGVNDELINIIKEINNEQRANDQRLGQSERLSNARRHASINADTEGRSPKDRRDTRSQSAVVGEEGLRPARSGSMGTGVRGKNQGSTDGAGLSEVGTKEASGEEARESGTPKPNANSDQEGAGVGEKRGLGEVKSASDTEIGGALVDRLGDMGLNVSTDLAANRQALKEAKADKSEAGAIHYYKTPSGQQYGFSYKGKVYLDPTKINAELPLHEYGHLWAEALRRLNPENWQHVVDTIKADKDAWEFVKSLRPELTDENEIAEEVIATFSGKKGAEKMRAEYDRMHGKDADYKSKWGNIFKNISKAIQDFWKAVGDFLNIKYESAEQVYDQVLKDFVDNMNPWKRVSDFLRQRDAEYVQAAESGDIKTATNIFYEALKENIGNGITPYMSVGTYNNLKRLAKGVKTRNKALIKEAADLIAPLIPDNAVLIPAPSHSGTATDMLDLAKAIAEVTGSEVADVLRSVPRESQYQTKKTTGVPMASKQLGIAVEGEIPADKTPIIIDNVVDSGNTAEACVQAVGKGVVVTLADSAEQYGHAASLKSAAPVLRDKDGKVIPLSKRFDLSGSRYLGRRMYLRPDDLRLSVSGTQTIPVGKNTLVGLHNISAEKLRKAIKMGGLANPSTAVINIASQNHEQYGDISLIMPSSLVDSKTGRNAGTFTGDIWSPTYPSVERIMSDKGDEAYYQAITKAFGDNEARRPILSRAKLDFDDYLDSGNVRAGLAYWYLLEKGIEPGDVYFNSGISDDIKRRFEPLMEHGLMNMTAEERSTLLSLIAEREGKTADDLLQEAQTAKKRYEETIADPNAKQFYKTIAQRTIDEIDLYGVRYNVLSNGYHAMERAIRNDGKIDLDSTLIAAQDIVQTQHQADFDKWLSDMDKRFDIKEVLFEDYDRDGNRIYKPHTLANASRMMNKEDLQNAGDHSGLGATRGQLVERMETLADIRAEKGRLRPGAEEDFETEEWNKMQDEWFNKVLNPLSEMQKISDNPFSQVGYAETRLQEALRTKDPIATLNKEFGYKIDPNGEWAKNLKDLVQRIKSLPTKYFETKFRRPVYLNEFANAVVPNDLPQDLRDGLEKAGLTLFEYDPKEEGARRAATLQATEDDGIRFSVSGGLSIDRTLTKAAREEMQQIKDAALADGTFMKAPNGKRSNLNERQWLQVRTRAFMRWFGDWENDPENASKVLDENGEPMVAKHGTPFTFTTFDKSKQQQNDAGWLGRGFYFFTKNDDYAAGYARGGQVINAFLNIREPYYATYADMERLAEMDSKEESERFTKGLIDEGYDGVYFDANLNGEWVAFNPNQIKSATDNDGSFSEENDDIRFSISNQNNDIFYSNAERAVEGIKQEKATPEQWRAMIEKAGGLKAGEDKWIGLSDWLAQQRPTVTPQEGETRSQFVERAAAENKRFTLSKQDLLDYIREHKIQIEEQEYEEYEEDALFLERKDEFKRYYDEAVEAGEEDPNEVAWDRMIEEYGDDFSMGYYAVGDELMRDNDSDYAQWEADSEGRPRNINETRLEYTTKGLDNKREIALVVPTIESWNESDEVHFGDAGEGRAIAWVRFGDAKTISKPEELVQAEQEYKEFSRKMIAQYGLTYTERVMSDSERQQESDLIAKLNQARKVHPQVEEKVLVIDEIQSKRHQEGREKGYDRVGVAQKRLEDYRKYLQDKYDTGNFLQDATPEEAEHFRTLVKEFNAEANRQAEAQEYDLIPAAPFEKNWHELAMKRILRFAAENGYDKVAWTTGDQQAARYNIGEVIDSITRNEDEDYPYSYSVMSKDHGELEYDFDENGIYHDDGDPELEGKSMSDVFGKELAKRLQEMTAGETIDNEGLRIGGEGMRGFYDDILPRFMQKYGKKWGVQVGEVTMPDLESGYQTMHAIDINDAMRESVMEGQPMFSISGRGVNGTMKPQEGETRSQYIARVAETVKNMTPRNTTIDDAIRFSITVNHNSPYLLKRADGAFVDPETGERLGFDHRFMGKGEGGQAHGWGSYFSIRDLRDYADPRDGKYLYKGKAWNELWNEHENPEMDAASYVVQEMEYGKTAEEALASAIEDTEASVTFHRKSDIETGTDYAKGFERRLEALMKLDVIDFSEADRGRHHYTVEIPDNTGSNYLEEDKQLTQEQVDRLREQAKKDGILKDIKGFLYCCENLEDYPFRKFLSDITTTADIGGAGMTDKEASEFLSRAGFVGIHYDGRRDGECYVIFNPDDAVITDHIRFSVTSGKSVLPKTPDASQVEHPMRSTYNTNGDIVGDDQIRFSVNLTPGQTPEYKKWLEDNPEPHWVDAYPHDPTKEFTISVDGESYSAYNNRLHKWQAEQKKVLNEIADKIGFEWRRKPVKKEEVDDSLEAQQLSEKWQYATPILSRSETVTKALVQQANNNYNIMQSALKKVTADLKGIRAAMRMQSDYDHKVVDALLNLYNTLLQENGVWAQYMPDTTRRIATQIVHAIGKQNITEEVNTIMDHMVHAQAKAAQRQWDKLRQTPIDKINISGVVMQGKVALEGQHALKAMNDALQANMTIEQIEEQINQLMDMEDNATDESLKTQYKGQWIGLTIAAQHLERLQHLQEERQQLDLELQSARSNKALKPAARQQLVDNIKQAMRDNYIEQAEAYTRSTQDLSEYVNTQEGRAKDFIRRQDANRDKIRSYAQRDLEGLATNPNRNRTRGNVARSIWDAFASPIRDLQSLLRLTGLHAPDGEGYLYNHFMRNWMDGADMERTGIVAASKTLDEKIAELTHGKYKTWEEAARKINDASHNMFGITMLNGVDGKDMPVTEEIPLNAGNALYIYAVNKMNDGRMKLNGMNITEEDVQALADKVREQFGQEILDVVDWVQSEFFSQLRNRYNPTHEALFGAPMDAIENYFPLRINANARQQNEDLSEPDTDAARLLAGTSTGAIKRRTRNSLPLDVRNADFFQEVIRHISQMERWNAFAQWNRDANILFSDINFRNRIKGMKGTIYGEGDKLYNYMKDAFRVAIGTYKPKTDTFSEITLNMAKGVTSAKINFRVFTALKQIASFPAFFTYMQDGVFVQSYLRNWLKPHETMKWAKENLPNFEKRVSKRDMGDMRLMQRSTDWQWNKRILEWSSKYGMFFNVFFDTLTCATGARAVYDSHLADYMKKGYSEEDARNRARQDAEQAFNTSQQSSEGAFMAPIQMDRNAVTAALTVFRTSPMQYTRNFFFHVRGLLRKIGEGKREEQIAFRMGQYKNDGLNDEQARKAAEKDYNKSIRADVTGVVVYGALLGILWRLVGSFPYLFFGDDDDKKKQIVMDAVTGGAFVQPITGLIGGSYIESALDGNGLISSMFAPELPFTQDAKRAEQYLQNNKYAEFASQALSVLMQSTTGFDPLTASDMVSRIVTTLDSEEELDAATQALRVSQALLSIPQSQYEQMLIDKVVSGETDEDAALEDYIRYQKIHTAPLTWWLRGEESDEKAEDNAEKRFNKLLTERDKIKNPEDYEE